MERYTLNLEKLNGKNFHAWKVKLQLHLINIIAWSSECSKWNWKQPTQRDKLVEWMLKVDKLKSNIGLGMSDIELHHLENESGKVYNKLGEV